MKLSIFSFLLLFVTSACLAQNPFKLIILDSRTKEPIENARVYVNELAASEKLSDQNGTVYYNNLPKDRKVKVNIRKKGYQYKTKEVLASPLAVPDNYEEVELDWEIPQNKVIIWGKIELKNGGNAPRARVRISFMGTSVSDTADEAGNYNFEIEKNRLEQGRSYTIEVEYSGCESMRESVAYYDGIVINRNIMLTPRQPESSAINNNIGPKPTENFTRQNITGQWIYNGIERGKKIVMLATCKSVGTSVFSVYIDGILREHNVQSEWRFEGDLVIEKIVGQPREYIGKLKWNGPDEYVVTVVDDGIEANRGLERRFKRQ